MGINAYSAILAKASGYGQDKSEKNGSRDQFLW